MFLKAAPVGINSYGESKVRSSGFENKDISHQISFRVFFLMNDTVHV